LPHGAEVAELVDDGKVEGESEDAAAAKKTKIKDSHTSLFCKHLFGCVSITVKAAYCNYLLMLSAV
jgi:hypothetical protein